MLRPATPLTLLLFIAFILLLISVISTPIVKGIPLASYAGVDFGVFGNCDGNKCTAIKVGYTTGTYYYRLQNFLDGEYLYWPISGLYWRLSSRRPSSSHLLIFLEDADARNDGNGGEMPLLPSSSRSSLSSILIVHPVAAFLTLVCLMLAASTHLDAPSHSPRYLLILLILLLPTLLISLLAFLVDILLFVPPHLAWGGWIVLGSTILITASGVVTCAMRRTLVSRKARKKRIAGNAEMNGETLYNNRPNAARIESPPPLNRQPPAPLDSLPAFPLYDAKSSKDIDDERIPLNTRSPSNRTVLSNGHKGDVSEDGSGRYAMPGRGTPGGFRSGRGDHNIPKDEFGNPLAPFNAFGPLPPPVRRSSADTKMRQEYSSETLNTQSSRGRGRDGYPPRGLGRGRPYGPGRGGVNGNGRGMVMGPVAADMGRGRQENPPPVYENGYPPYPGPERGMTGQYPGSEPANSSRDPLDAAYGRRKSPGPQPRSENYGRRPSPGPPSVPGNYSRHTSPGPPSAPGRYSRRQSPGPPLASGAYGRQSSPGLPSMPGSYGRRPSPGPPSAPSGYGRQPSPGPPSAPSGYGRQPSPGRPWAPGFYAQGGRTPSPRPVGLPAYRTESPPPPLPHTEPQVIGQAVEMDAFTGSPSHSPAPNPHTAARQLQQNRDSPISLASAYSASEPYVSPRAAWAAGAVRGGTPPKNSPQPLSPNRDPPVELAPQSPRSLGPQPSSLLDNRKLSADNYYEDVDPRFTNPDSLPTSLIPGGNQFAHQPPSRSSNNSPARFKPSISYESIPEDGRRPSDGGNLTPVSQRGVNHNLRPSIGSNGISAGNRNPTHSLQQNSVLLSNPDFEIPDKEGNPTGLRGEGGAP